MNDVRELFLDVAFAGLPEYLAASRGEWFCVLPGRKFAVLDGDELASLSELLATARVPGVNELPEEEIMGDWCRFSAEHGGYYRVEGDGSPMDWESVVRIAAETPDAWLIGEYIHPLVDALLEDYRENEEER